jgi:hypothetical protein
MGKAKPTKHTSAELKKKEFDATVNRGGGTAGIQDRKGGNAGHSRYACKVCAQAAPDPKSLQAHFESKHGKMGPFNMEEHGIDNRADGGAPTTQGVAVRGGIKKHHN